MTIVVETGAGLADAESYASVAQYKARCDALGVSYADISDTVIEQRLRLGFEHMGEAYRLRWAGNRVSATQAGDWPRDNVPVRDGPGSSRYPSFYPNNSIPTAVLTANIDLAVKAADGPLTPDLTQAIKREKVGAIETEYADYSRATKSYPAIDARLTPFFAAQGGIAIMRA